MVKNKEEKRRVGWGGGDWIEKEDRNRRESKEEENKCENGSSTM